MSYTSDRFGIAIIDETPAVGLAKASYFSEATLVHHKQVITEMISRERNHSSVFMWSVANEPSSGLAEAKSHFSAVANFTRPLAAGRPVTFVTYFGSDIDKCVEFFNVICVNRYYSWYSYSGRLNQISWSVRDHP